MVLEKTLESFLDCTKEAPVMGFDQRSNMTNVISVLKGTGLWSTDWRM